MGVIVEGKKKFKCKVCGCKFTLNNDYEYFEKKTWKYPMFSDSYYLHQVFVRCPQCSNPIETNRYKEGR